MTAHTASRANLAAALDAEESRLEASASDWERHLFAYRTFSMYAQPLDQWRTLVGPERVCTLFLEELLSQPARELRRVMEFLDVPQLDPNGTATMNHRNKIAYPRSISVQRWCQRWIRWGDAGASLPQGF